jgi:hypothetical protein
MLELVNNHETSRVVHILQARLTTFLSRWKIEAVRTARFQMHA